MGMLKSVKRSFDFRVFLQTQELLNSWNICMCFASPSFLRNQNASFSSSSTSGNVCPEQNPYFGALFSKLNDLGCQHHYSSREGEPNPRPDGSHDSHESGEAFEGPLHSPGRSSASEFSEMYGLDDLSQTDEESDGVDDSNDDSEFGVLDLFKRNTEPRESGERFSEEKDDFRHPLVKETCRLIGLRHAWNPKLEGELRSLLRSLNPPQVSAVLRSQPDARLSVSYFHWADRQWRYRHSPEIYRTMLEILSKTKLSQASRRVLRLMLRRGITRKPEDFANVMVSYSRAGKLRSAMRVLNLMQKDGCSPDLVICNAAIHVLVMANRLEKALRFLHRMQSVGINPDVVTFNCLIKGFCSVHRVEEALEMIREMAFKGCPPDKISYYTVITFLCKEKRVEEVRELLQKMKNDSNLIPDQVTHNLLIHVLSKHGHSDEALGFLHESQGKGFHVDKVGYSAIIHSFCRDGRMEEAKDIAKDMISKGCLPDVVTYTAVVNGFCRIGKIDQARKLMDYMYKRGCKPNAITYTALLNGLCRIGSSIEAQGMLNKSEEEWWTPTSITYSVVVHGLRREGKIAEACDLVMQMIKNGFFPTPIEINQLIHALCKDGKPVEAKKFMEDCQSKGCAITVVTFTTLIHGFCQGGDLVSALSLLDDMFLSNRHPDVVTYTVIIDALGKNERFEEVSELVKNMLNRGLVPTPITYRAVIHRFCARGSIDELLKLLDKMLARQGFRTAYNQVIEKLCGFGRLDEAYKIIGKVLRTASKVDADTCHILMDCFLKRGLPLSAYNLACRMFRRNLIPSVKLCQKAVCYEAPTNVGSKEWVDVRGLIIAFIKTDYSEGLRNRLIYVALPLYLQRGCFHDSKLAHSDYIEFRIIRLRACLSKLNSICWSQGGHRKKNLGQDTFIGIL